MSKSLKVRLAEGVHTLRVHRVAAGLSQVELAEKADIRPETISRIESGHHYASRKTIRDICRALDSSPMEVFPREVVHAIDSLGDGSLR